MAQKRQRDAKHVKGGYGGDTRMAHEHNRLYGVDRKKGDRIR